MTVTIQGRFVAVFGRPDYLAALQSARPAGHSAESFRVRETLDFAERQDSWVLRIGDDWIIDTEVPPDPARAMAFYGMCR